MRLRHIAVLSATLVAMPASPAHAAASTFVGGSSTSCSRPPAPFFGTSTGTGTCTVIAASSCVTAVDVNEVAVAAPCSVRLEGTTSLFFVQARTEQGGPLHVHCFGSGSGTVKYTATPSAPEHTIPVTISVQDGTASFVGAYANGVVVIVVKGTYTNACGGNGVFAGEVL